MNRIRPLIVIVFAIASATLLWACGGDGGGEDPEEVLQAVSDADQSIDSGTLDLSMDVSAGGEQEGSFELNASGPFQGGEGKFPSFDIAGDFSAEGSGQSFSAEGALISTGKSAFLSYQDTAYQLPQQVFDQISTVVTSAQEQQGEGADDACQQALESQGLGTTSLLTDLSNEGDEEIGGAETIHITGGLDFAKVSEFIKASTDTPECSGALGQQLDQTQLGQVESQLSQVQDFFKDFEIGLYVGKDDDLVHGFDVSFGVDAQGQQVDFDLEARIGDVNQPQTVEEPQNVQSLNSLLQNLGIDSSVLNQALGQLGTASGGGGALPQAGGSPAGPSPGDTDAYLNCIQQAQGAAALQECQGLLQ